MRPTDPRENLYPVLPAETYRRLGITPPRPLRPYAGGPVSAAGTPYLTGSAVTGAPPGIPAGSVRPNPLPPPHFPGPAHLAPGAGGPARKDRTLWIVAGATAAIIAIIVTATAIILASLGPDDEQQVRDAIAAETRALNARDLDGVIANRCEADVRALQRQFTSATFAAEVDSMIGPGGRWEVTVGSVRVDAAAGTAVAEQTTVPVGSGAIIPQTVTDTAALRKESGAWKVCVSSSSVR
ncbi:hypothetical protein GCM10027289_22810 [Tsukamurella serpentis]